AGAEVNEAMRPRKPTGKGVRAGTSALILAVENSHFELALDLLEAGADPNDQRSGYTALHTLSWVRKPNRGDGDDGDPAPAGSGNLSSLQFVRKLVERGADVNARIKSGKSGTAQLNRTGATPFLLAAFTDDAPLMRLLLELGADPLRGNADGATPLMAAAGLGTLAPTEEAGTEEEALESVQLLLQLGAEINTVDKNGETAVHGAAYKSLPRMVHFLAEHGANIELWNRKNKWGWTPLRIAEGYRPGNFKPSAETIEAIHQVMLTANVKPPVNSEAGNGGEEYAAAKKAIP
ncbi:MAG TPA: ankyrin repeat domain-containing protein, partial [Verrucomicrobiae bacterium]|nr:ankyrin repeat domain-containing protein [Verrucomicrobiae bacterium]